MDRENKGMYPGRSLRYCAAALLIGVLSLFSLQCSSSLPFNGIDRSFDFNRSFNVTVFIQPSGNDTVDIRLKNLIELQFITKGYRMVYVDPAFVPSLNGEWLGHQAVAETLLQRTKARSADLIVIAKPTMDSVSFNWKGNSQYYYHKKSLRLQMEVTVIDRSTRAVVAAHRSVEMQRSFQDELMAGTGRHYQEPLRILIERSLNGIFGDLPFCALRLSAPPAYRFPLVVMVDDSYRSLFPDWKDRLTLRMFYVNHILRNQFDMTFDVVEYREWKYQFSVSLEQSLKDLQYGAKNPRMFTLGVTNNPMLRHSMSQRSTLGMAAYLGTHAMFTAQPVFPDAHEWNSIEEALTIVHEFGHIFGAPHVAEERSVMHPMMESMSYHFDRTTHLIIESTRNDFLALDPERRFRTNITTIADAYQTAPSAHVEVISMLGTIAGQLIREVSRKNRGAWASFDSVEYVHRLLPDSSLASAALGYIAYRDHQWKRASQYFLKAAEFREEFSETYWYAGKCAQRLGDTAAAVAMLERAKKGGVTYAPDE